MKAYPILRGIHAIWLGFSENGSQTLCSVPNDAVSIILCLTSTREMELVLQFNVTYKLIYSLKFKVVMGWDGTDESENLHATN